MSCLPPRHVIMPYPCPSSCFARFQNASRNKACYILGIKENESDCLISKSLLQIEGDTPERQLFCTF